jgi:hypothetical protein
LESVQGSLNPIYVWFLCRRISAKKWPCWIR